MKKIVASEKYLVVWSVIILFCALMTVICFVFGIVDLVKHDPVDPLAFVGGVIFLAVAVYYVLDLNRMACYIWVEGGAVKRQGLFGGFFKECKSESIQRVVIKDFYRDGTFIYLVDNSKHQFNRRRNDSYIGFEYTKDNVEFLRTFWSGEIEK